MWLHDRTNVILGAFFGILAILFFVVPARAFWGDGDLLIVPGVEDAVHVTYEMGIDTGVATSTFDRTGCSNGVRNDGTEGGNTLYSWLHYYQTDTGTTSGTYTNGGYVVSDGLTVSNTSSTYSWTLDGLPVPATFDGAGMACGTPNTVPHQWPVQSVTLVQGTPFYQTVGGTLSFDSSEGTDPTGGITENWLQYNNTLSATQISVVDITPTVELQVCSITTPLRTDGTLWSPEEIWYMQIIQLTSDGQASAGVVASSDNVVTSDSLPNGSSYTEVTFTFEDCPTLLPSGIIERRYGFRFQTTNPFGTNTSPNGSVLRWMPATNNNWTTEYFTANGDARFRDDGAGGLGTYIGTISMSSTPLSMQIEGFTGGGASSTIFIHQRTDGTLNLDGLTATSTNFFSNLYTSSTQAICDQMGSGWLTNAAGGFGGALADCLVDISRYLFVPDQTALNAFKGSAAQILAKAPFGYATQIASSTTAIFESQSSSSTDVNLTIPAGDYNGNATQTMTLFSTAEWEEKVGTLIAPIRTVLGVLLWFSFLAGLYYFAVHVANPNG